MLSTNFIMNTEPVHCTVHCLIHTLQHTNNTVECTKYHTLCKLYNIHCKLYIVHHLMYSTQCTACTKLLEYYSGGGEQRGLGGPERPFQHSPANQSNIVLIVQVHCTPYNDHCILYSDKQKIPAVV